MIICRATAGTSRQRPIIIDLDYTKVLNQSKFLIHNFLLNINITVNIFLFCISGLLKYPAKTKQGRIHGSSYECDNSFSLLYVSNNKKLPFRAFVFFLSYHKHSSLHFNIPLSKIIFHNRRYRLPIKNAHLLKTLLLFIFLRGYTKLRYVFIAYKFLCCLHHRNILSYNTISILN